MEHLVSLSTVHKIVWGLNCSILILTFVIALPKNGFSVQIADRLDLALAILTIISSSIIALRLDSPQRISYVMTSSRREFRRARRRFWKTKPVLNEYHIMPICGAVEHLRFWTSQDLDEDRRQELAVTQNKGAYGDTRDERVNYWIDRRRTNQLRCRLPEIQIEPECFAGEQHPATAEPIVRDYLDPTNPRPFSSASDSKRYAVFFRRENWVEAKVVLMGIPEGDYDVYWYFANADGGSYDNTEDPLHYQSNQMPVRPTRLHVRVGKPGPCEHLIPWKRDDVVVLNDMRDQHIINLSTEIDTDDSDEPMFPRRFVHQLHHDFPERPLVFHMFVAAPERVFGRFIWAGCKLVPKAGTY